MFIIICLLTLMAIGLPLTVQANPQQASSHHKVAPIVIVSSYNPDVKSQSDNISDFYDEYTKSGLHNPIVVEDIGAQNLPDGKNWTTRLRKVLAKYYDEGKKPACIVLIGIEASSAYFSLDEPAVKATPVVMGLRSLSILKMPQPEAFDHVKWKPKVYNLSTDFEDFNIVGGRVYDYDMKKNLDLIKHFYPKCDTITFVSDNSLGGITMRADFEHYIRTDKRFVVKYIDGRTMTFVDVDETISELPPTQALLVGTWRVDASSRYVVRNTTYTFCQNNPHLPVFSMSDVGLGHWPVAGYSPRYHIMGRYLADDVVQFLQTGKKKKITIAECKYYFDFERLKVLKLSLRGFPYPYESVNKPVSVFEQYRKTIISVIVLIIVLASALVISLKLLHKSKLLRRELVKQGKKLLIAKEAAENANKMKSSFIANISHEIRTPLHAVLGFSQILVSDQFELSPEEKKEYGELIMTNSDLLLKLVNDVLDISKIDAGKMLFNMEEVDAVALINAAAQSASTNKKPEVEICVKSKLKKAIIETDKDRLLQVVSNLLNNANKCTERGTITISLTRVVGHDAISISVTDTGCGIPKEKAKLVFERFKKLNSFSQGTGLGLSICQTIVEQLGGKIWVDTSYTGGARFTFTHPIHPEMKVDNNQNTNRETRK